MYILIILSTLISLLSNTAKSLELGIVHIENVTTKSCGLRSFASMPPLPAHPSCFKWHKTIFEETSEKLYMSGISGGRYAKPGENPYTVLILAGNFRCSGAIINEFWIITAAHCLDRVRLKAMKFYVGITTYPQENSTYYVGDMSIAHENYDIKDYKTFYDIALIKLETKIKLSKDLVANSVCLPAIGFEIDKPELAVFSGWGYISDQTLNKEALKVTLVKLNRKYSSGGIIVTNDVSLGIICNGDSGGPLVQYVNGRAVIIGICVITEPQEGLNCGPITSVKFTSIRYHMKWIIDKIADDYDYE